jgi:hypothetical protein
MMANTQRPNTYSGLSESDLHLLAHQATREAAAYLDANRLRDLPMLLGVVPQGQTVVQWHNIDALLADNYPEMEVRSALQHLGAETAMSEVPVGVVFLLMPAYDEPSRSNAALAARAESQELVALLGLTHSGNGVKIVAEVLRDGSDDVRQLHIISSYWVQGADEVWSILPYFWLGYVDSIAH